MRVLLSTYGSRGGVEPLVGLAARLRGLGTQVRVCAPPDEDFAQRLAEVGVPLAPVGPSARALTRAAPPPASLPRRAAELIAGQLDTVTEAAQGCDVLVATGALPAAAGALSVAEKLGVRSVSVTFQQLTLPAPHRRPLAYPGRPLPPEVTDNEVLWELDARSTDALFNEALNTNRASIGLPPVESVRDYVIGDRPWLATDPVLDPWRKSPDLEVVQTGAWVLPDGRPLPADLVAFLEAGAPPVYVGFGSMPLHAAADIGRVAVEAVRAGAARGGGPGVGRSVPGRRPGRLLRRRRGEPPGAVRPGGRRRAPRRRRYDDGRGAGRCAPGVVDQLADQPCWAGRVAGLAIDAAHDGPTPTCASLPAALGTALAPETRVRAAAVAGRVRTDGVSVAARLRLDAHG